MTNNTGLDLNNIKDSYVAIWLAYQPRRPIYQSEIDVLDAIKQHTRKVPRYLMLEAYAEGFANIFNRMRLSELESAINYKLVYQEPSYIERMVSGYGYGAGGTYQIAEDVDNKVKTEKALSEVERLYRRQNTKKQTKTLAKYQSRYGVAVDKVYVDKNAEPRAKAKKPLNAFVVYNNEDEQEPVYSVEYTRIYTPKDQEDYYEVAVYDDVFVTKYKTNTVAPDKMNRLINIPQINSLGEPTEKMAHNVKTNPITEVWNNDDLLSDVEPAISLIDAKNEAGSDHINAVRQFIENILVFYGISLGNNEKESTKQYNKIKKNRWFSTKFGQGSRIENVTQQINNEGMIASQNQLTSDIAKYSMVPDFTSERYSNIISGIALSFGLIGIEVLLEDKNPFMVSALQARLQKYTNVLVTKGGEELDVLDVTITFTTKRPNVDQETALIIPSALSVGVKKEVLAKEFSFVNSDEQLEEVEETKEFSVDELFAQADGNINPEEPVEEVVEEEVE
jgi:SPP1 family phage portal protein